jgi:hypothetical protein
MSHTTYPLLLLLLPPRANSTQPKVVEKIIEKSIIKSVPRRPKSVILDRQSAPWKMVFDGEPGDEECDFQHTQYVLHKDWMEQAKREAHENLEIENASLHRKIKELTEDLQSVKQDKVRAEIALKRKNAASRIMADARSVRVGGGFHFMASVSEAGGLNRSVTDADLEDKPPKKPPSDSDPKQLKMWDQLMTVQMQYKNLKVQHAVVTQELKDSKRELHASQERRNANLYIDGEENVSSTKGESLEIRARLVALESQLVMEKGRHQKELSEVLQHSARLQEMSDERRSKNAKLKSHILKLKKDNVSLTTKVAGFRSQVDELMKYKMIVVQRELEESQRSKLKEAALKMELKRQQMVLRTKKDHQERWVAASVLLQARWRSFKDRKRYSELQALRNKKATTLQSHILALIVRRRYLRERAEKMAAIKKIQRWQYRHQSKVQMDKYRKAAKRLQAIGRRMIATNYFTSIKIAKLQTQEKNRQAEEKRKHDGIVVLQRRRRGSVARNSFLVKCNATVKLQAVVRGWLFRDRLLELTEAAISIQAMERGKQARSYETKKNAAAIQIQTISRGRKERRVVAGVSKGECGVLQTEIFGLEEEEPHAGSGATTGTTTALPIVHIRDGGGGGGGPVRRQQARKGPTKLAFSRYLPTPGGNKSSLADLLRYGDKIADTLFLEEAREGNVVLAEDDAVDSDGDDDFEDIDAADGVPQYCRPEGMDAVGWKVGVRLLAEGEEEEHYEWYFGRSVAYDSGTDSIQVRFDDEEAGGEDERVRLSVGPSSLRFVRRLLHVTVIQACNLANRDLVGKSDPFVLVKVGKEQCRTKIVENSLNPTWNEGFWLDPGPNPSSSSLEIFVWDKDTVSVSDEFLGQVTLPVLVFLPTCGTDTKQSFHLMDKKGRKGKGLGSIELGFKCQSIEPKLPQKTEIVTKPIEPIEKMKVRPRPHRTLSELELDGLNLVLLKVMDGSNFIDHTRTPLNRVQCSVSVACNDYTDRTKYGFLQDGIASWDEKMCFPVLFKDRNKSIHVHCEAKQDGHVMTVGDAEVNLKLLMSGKPEFLNVPLYSRYNPLHFSTGTLRLALHWVSLPQPVALRFSQVKLVGVGAKKGKEWKVTFSSPKGPSQVLANGEHMVDSEQGVNSSSSKVISSTKISFVWEGDANFTLSGDLADLRTPVKVSVQQSKSLFFCGIPDVLGTAQVSLARLLDLDPHPMVLCLRNGRKQLDSVRLEFCTQMDAEDGPYHVWSGLVDAAGQNEPRSLEKLIEDVFIHANIGSQNAVHREDHTLLPPIDRSIGCTVEVRAGNGDEWHQARIVKYYQDEKKVNILFEDGRREERVYSPSVLKFVENLAMSNSDKNVPQGKDVVVESVGGISGPGSAKLLNSNTRISDSPGSYESIDSSGSYESEDDESSKKDTDISPKDQGKNSNFASDQHQRSSKSSGDDEILSVSSSDGESEHSRTSDNERLANRNSRNNNISDSEDVDDVHSEHGENSNPMMQAFGADDISSSDNGKSGIGQSRSSKAPRDNNNISTVDSSSRSRRLEAHPDSSDSDNDINQGNGPRSSNSEYNSNGLQA